MHLSLASVKALVRAISSSFCEDDPDGRRLASVTLKRLLIAYAESLYWLSGHL